MIKRGILHFSARRRSTEGSVTTTCSEEEAVECEVRPGGMLVQRRSSGSRAVPPPDLRIQVDYGGRLFQISANSQSTFGELKKLLAAETGLQPGEQRLVFRGRERESGEYLDTCGVKDRSKVSVMEDPEKRRRKLLELRRDAKIQAVRRLIDGVSTEVDTLAEQVSVIEKSIASGSKVAEVQITTLTEMLMRQAVKLDSIAAEGDACADKDAQGKRVQKCVETLDELKVLNAKERVSAAVVTTNWGTFDPSPPLIQWELFD